MKPEESKRKQVAGLLYGLAAGLAFAIFAWGIDSVLLASAHGAFAWVKFVPGLFICVLSGGLVGWLTVKLQKAWPGIILWVAQALLFAHLVLWLPLKVAPVIIRVFNPALGEFLKYPYYPELKQNLWICFIIVAAVSIICGLLENILIDQALFSSGKYAIAIPLLIASMAFALVGKSSDSLLNKNFREPIQTVDRLIDFAIENKDNEVSTDIARKMRLFALSNVQEFVTKDRKLILSNFDEVMGQVDVLVDFEGQWVKCPVIYNQIVTCSQIFESPWIRTSNVLKFAKGVPSHPEIQVR